VLKLTYDNTLIFRVKKYDIPDENTGIIQLSEALDKLEFEFTQLKGASNEARYKVYDILSKLSIDNAEVFKLILKKDLKCGISVKTINKAFNHEFLRIPRYMGACTFSEKDIKKLFEKAKKTNTEVWSEIKFDGMYINLFIEKNICKSESRSGKRVFVEDAFKDFITPSMNNRVFMGELLVKGVDRYTSNGLINSYTTMKEKDVNGELSIKDIQKFYERYNKNYEEIHKDIYMKVWDTVTLEEYEADKSNDGLKVRRSVLRGILEDNEALICVEHKVIDSIREAFLEFKRAKENGEEGTIVKLSSVMWKNGKPKDQLKYKLEFDVEMKVIDTLKGNPDTKYENFTNRLICKSSDNLVNIRTSALTEDDMETITAMGDEIIGKIITVQCSGLSENNKGEKSLLHPRFMLIRDDKTEADSYEKMKENEEMCSALGE
jgi:DNA ligase-1